MTDISAEVPSAYGPETVTEPAAMGPRPDTPAAGARKVHALQLQHETALEFYARRTANATIFIAWVVGIFAVASLIIGIIVGVQLSHLSNAVNGAGSGAICQSQGGPLPNC